MKGVKTGGRKKGIPNKATQKRRDVARKALKAGMTPLDVLLEAMRDAYKDGGARGAAPHAKEAAPYVHPRLSAIAMKAKLSENPWEEMLALARVSAANKLTH